MKSLAAFLLASVILLSPSAWCQSSPPPPAIEAPPEAGDPIPLPAEEEQTSASLPVPPLGLGDVAELLMRTHDLLGEELSTPSLVARREATEIVRHCASYMMLIAQTRQGRIAYEWRTIGKRKRIAAGPASIKEFKTHTPIQDATVLRLKAFYSDVFIEQLVIHEASGEGQTIPLAQWIRADLPRSTIVRLDLPVSVSRVYATCRHESERLPRIGIEIGVPAAPEFPREIEFLCRRILLGIEREDWPSSRDAVSRAMKRLSEFRGQRSG